MKRAVLLLSTLLISLTPMMQKGYAQEVLKPGASYTFTVPAFSISFPQECLEGKTIWRLTRKDLQYDRIELEGEQEAIQASGNRNITIRFFSNPILSDSIRGLTPEEIADDFRNNEINSMLELGVKKGLYQLENIKLFTDSIGEKQFYVLSYATILKEGLTITGWLFLYVPKETNNTNIFCAHYAEILNSINYNNKYEAAQLTCFRFILERLLVTEESRTSY